MIWRASDAPRSAYESVKQAADANGMTVEETLAMIAHTSDKDRGEHPGEYAG